MRELLQDVWNLCVGVAQSAWDLGEVALVFVVSFLQHLHADAPRLEGLLVGVALSWLLLRRDKHPLLRVLSAPLKLVVDILDLAWDQCVEVVGDLWDTAAGWVRKAWDMCWGAVRGVWDRGMAVLSGLRDRLSRKE